MIFGGRNINQQAAIPGLFVLAIPFDQYSLTQQYFLCHRGNEMRFTLGFPNAWSIDADQVGNIFSLWTFFILRKSNQISITIDYGRYFCYLGFVLKRRRESDE